MRFNRLPNRITSPKGETYDTLPELVSDALDNNPHAINRLGVAFAEGQLGLPINLKKAFSYYAYAAENGSPHALYNMGMAKIRGDGTRQNHPRALRYFRQAAEKGNPHACLAVGTCYANGTGTSTNQSLATQWYLTAAHHGHIDAYVIMAARYGTGIGVEREDPLQSMMLAALAAKTEPDKARKSRWERLYFKQLASCCDAIPEALDNDKASFGRFTKLHDTLYLQASDAVDTHIIPPPHEKDRKNWELDITGQGLRTPPLPHIEYLINL